MRVLRDSSVDPAADHRRTRELVDRVAETGEPAARVWRPPKHVAFGRRDANAEGYERAKAAARERGYPPMEREVGGRAVAFTGDTVAFAIAESVGDERTGDGARTGIQERYDRVTAAVLEALAALGVDAERGEPPNSFCPGTHSLRVDGGKVAGFAQRVRRDVAVVAGVVVPDAPAAVADVLAPIYDALGVPFDAAAVGSLAAAGESPGEAGRPVDPAAVRDGIAAALEDAVGAAPVRDT